MKKTLTLSLTISALLFAGVSMAQSDDTQKKKIRIVTEKNENGVVTKLDTTIEFSGSEAELEEITRKFRGADEEGGDVKVKTWVDEDGRTHVEKEIRVTKDGDDDGEHRIMIRSNGDGDGEEMDVRIEKTVDDDGKVIIKKFINGKEVQEDFEGGDDGVQIMQFKGEDGDKMDVRIEKTVDADGNVITKKYVNGKEVDPGDDDGHEMIFIEKGDGGNGTVEITVDNDVTVTKDGDKTIEKRVVVITRVTKKELGELKKTESVGPALDKKEMEAGDLKFFPNPTDGRFHLSFSLPEKTPVTVRIVDVQGKVIYTEDVKGFSGTYNKDIDISSSGKGVYFMQVVQGDKAMTKKVVIE